VECKKQIQRSSSASGSSGGRISEHNSHHIQTPGGLGEPLLPSSESVETNVSYIDIADFSFGRVGKAILSFSQLFTQIGFGCIYIVFILNNIHQYWNVSEWINLAVFVPVIMVVLFSPSLKFLAPALLFSNVSCVLAILLILSCAVNTNVSMEVPWNMPQVNIDDAPLFFGVACYAYCVHGMILSVEGSMQEPKHFNKLFNVVMVIVVIIYLLVGAIGYLAFQDNTKSDITDNLEDVFSPYLVGIVKWALVVALLGIYPLQMWPVVEIFEGAIVFQPHSPFKYLLRASIVMVTVIVAKYVPFFGLIISFIGSFSNSIVSFIFPPLCYLKLSWMSMNRVTRFFNVLILCFGLVATAVATTLAVSNLLSCFEDSSQDLCK